MKNEDLMRDLLAISRTPLGLRVLNEIIARSGLNAAPGVGDSDRHLCFHEGRRSLGHEIHTLLEKGRKIENAY